MNEDLLEELKAKRNQLASSEGVPAYCYGSNQLLEAIAEEMPEDKWDLLNISGFGEGLYNRWGSTVLRIVGKYRGSRRRSGRRIISRGANQRSVEEEYQALLSLCRRKRFRSPLELSIFIRSNNLGYDYPHIAGTLTFENRNRNMEGAIAPKYYARLCRDLGFDEERGDAIPDEFTPYCEQ